LSGALTGDVLGSWSKTLALVATVASKGKLVQKLGQGVARTSASAVRGRGRYFGAILLCLIPGSVFAGGALQLPVGYITKATCHGRLLISAVGDEQLVELSALPRELGCGVLLKPKVDRGKTNLILET